MRMRFALHIFEVVHIKTCEKFIDDISGKTNRTYLWNSKKAASKGRRVPSRAVRKGLRYPDEDIEAMNNYVLVTPYNVGKDGEIVVPREFTSEPLL